MSINEQLTRWLTKQLGLRLDEQRVRQVNQWFKSQFPNFSNRELRQFLSLRDEDKGAAFWQSVTVRETYFFRERSHFEFLTREVFKWLSKDKGPFTIWCAGCATGEEAYTLAIVLAKFGLDKFRIIGTDINPHSVQKAKEGLFTPYSLRKVDPGMLSKYFHKQGELYRIDEQLRNSIDFFTLNLLNSPYPAELQNCQAIFCRNVFIYMEQRAVQQILKNFSIALREEGVLFLGISELVSALHLGLIPAGSHRVYKKIAGKDILRVPKVPPQAWPPDAGPNSPAKGGENLQAVEQVIKEKTFDEALEYCRKELYLHPDNPQLHFYTGILLARITAEGALEEFCKAAYLDQNHIQARYHTAELLTELQRSNEARQVYKDLLDLLKKKKEEELVDQEEGLTVGFFIKACNLGLNKVGQNV